MKELIPGTMILLSMGVIMVIIILVYVAIVRWVFKINKMHTESVKQRVLLELLAKRLANSSDQELQKLYFRELYPNSPLNEKPKTNQ